MNEKRCPQCGSDSRSMANRLRGKLSHYACRDAWHMPALTDAQEDALAFVAAVDAQFSGEPELEPLIFGTDRTKRPASMSGCLL